MASSMERGASSNTFLGSFSAFAQDIKLAHSIFALPFAASAFNIGRLPFPTPTQILLLVLCMIGARSFAMGMNRYLDRGIDADNPRTKNRMLPSGRLTVSHSRSWIFASAALLVVSAWALGPVAGFCALPLLVILALYSMMKRWSWATHWYLGGCLGLAPAAVAIAVQGHASLPLILLGAAVTVWTAGFDILYSLQDLDFDKRVGLKSVASRFGPRGALWISRACFAAMITLLGAVGLQAGRGALYAAGVSLIALVLAYEHWLIRDARDDGRSANLNAAFFNANAAVSIIYLVFAEIDLRVLG